MELHIRRCEQTPHWEGLSSWSDGPGAETKLHKKTIGKKAKEAGFRDYIKYFCKVTDNLLIFSAGVETTTNQLLNVPPRGAFKDPPEAPYVKFTFLFRSGCIHPILRFTADSRLFG